MIKITSRGIPELQAWLKNLVSNVKDVATRAVANYIVGDQTYGLMHEPYYKYVNRQAGFPNLSYITSKGTVVPGFASKEQHGYVMAMIKKGVIRPGQDNRTHDLTNSFRYVTQGSRYVITNNDPAALYVIGGQQTRMHDLIGWRKMADVAKTNLAGAYRHAKSKILEWIRAHPKR